MGHCTQHYAKTYCKKACGLCPGGTDVGIDHAGQGGTSHGFDSGDQGGISSGTGGNDDHGGQGGISGRAGIDRVWPYCSNSKGCLN